MIKVQTRSTSSDVPNALLYLIVSPLLKYTGLMAGVYSVTQEPVNWGGALAGLFIYVNGSMLKSLTSNIQLQRVLQASPLEQTVQTSTEKQEQ